MRIFSKAKDGGPDSNVDAYFLCEFKGCFSVALLKFNRGTRDAYHTHAFDALTWFLKGALVEEIIESGKFSHYEYTRSLFPKVTRKERLHRVRAIEDSWCLTIRGPWSKTWKEYDGKFITTFLHGRKIKNVKQHNGDYDAKHSRK